MDELIEQLLACSNEEGREAVLEAHRGTFSSSGLVSALKARADTHLRDEPAQARYLADIATTVADWCGQPEAQALAAWSRANARYYEGHFPECLALYEEALAFFDQAGDPLAGARLRSNCSAVLCHLGRYREALTHLESARAALASQDPSPYLADLEMNLAMVHQQLDRYSEAVAACERGRTVALAIGDQARAARLDVNRAVALEGLDRFREAIDLLLATIPILEAEGEQLEAARAYLNLGWLRFHTGHYRQALIDLETARHRFTELDNAMEVATADLHRAQVYLHLNLLPEVIELCESAQAAFLGDREVLRYAALAEYHTGIAYGRLGERETALQHLIAARERMADLGLPIQAALIDLERANLLLGRSTLTIPKAAAARPNPEHIAEAQALAEAAYGLFEARGLTLKATWAQIVLADAWRGTGGLPAESVLIPSTRPGPVQASEQFLEAARDTYTEALTILEEIGPVEARYRTWYGLGRLAEMAGRREEALAHYRRAIEAVTATAAALGESDLRAGFLHDKLDAFQVAVILSLDIGQAEEAFELVELARAGGWMPQPDEAAQVPDMDAEAQRLLAEVARLRETWHWRYSRLRSKDVGLKPFAEKDPVREMQAWKGLHTVERRLTDAIRTLRLRLATSPGSALETVTSALLSPALDRGGGAGPGAAEEFSPRGRGLGVSKGHRPGKAKSPTWPGLVTPVDVAAHLAEGQCLLAYYVAGDRIAAFVITRTGYTATLLPTTWTAVTQRLDRLRFSLHRQGSDTLEHLHWLWIALLAPLAQELADCRHLIVVPHDRLHYLPFHALHDGASYLLERYQVTYPPTISLLAWRSPIPNPQSLISNPQSPPLALILACSDHGRLPGTLAEGQAVHAALTPHARREGISPYTALLYLDADATSTRLRQYAPDCTLLHIAAHGHFRHDNPLFSALHLGDGPLLLADLDDLRLREASLVVLSACETGLGDLRGGDVLGLSRAFLRAGAQGLLVSLWRVSDEATARLMADFYQHLARSTPPTEALRQAQQSLLAETRYAHPQQWAGWALVTSSLI
jgi:CHAT domain-containing protein/tetratricopeptide (TPR) repeat protein